MTSTRAKEAPLSRLVGALTKRRDLKRYLTILPWRLMQDYGHKGPYTPAQVEATILRHKVSSPRHKAYALAIFCDRKELERRRREGDLSDDFERLRREIGETYFDGTPDFSLRDVGRHSSEHGGTGEAGGHSGHGGSYHDGGGDGGGGHH